LRRQAGKAAHDEAQYSSDLERVAEFAKLVPMNMLETISIDVYPWAVPTPEQRAWFDALSPEDKRKAIQAAIEEGFNSAISDKTMVDIIREIQAESGHDA
jgi:hypothetical protein